MTFEVFTRPEQVEPSLGDVDGPAVAVFRAGSAGPDDALVINAAAHELLCEVNGPGGAGLSVGRVVSVELLYDPDSDTAGIRPCRQVAGPAVFPIDVTRFRGDGSGAWSMRMWGRWPVKVPAGPFMRHWRLVGTTLVNPRPACLDGAGTMLTFPAAREAAR